MKCFLGAHGTGKTTLCQEIRMRKPNYFVTDAFSRPIKKASEKLNDIRPKGGLNELQQQLLNFELMMWAQENYYNYDFVISTRSLFDSVIFARIFNPYMDIKYLTQHLLENKHKISKIFYLPVEFPLEHDGIRYDSKIQIQFDQEAKSLITELDLSIIMLKGSVENRMTHLLPHL